MGQRVNILILATLHGKRTERRTCIVEIRNYVVARSLLKISIIGMYLFEKLENAIENTSIVKTANF